jgi:hypothetical protein
MVVARLKNLFDHSPAIRLVRSSNAPFIVDFLTSQFKQSGHITRVHSELLSNLREFQADLRRSRTRGLSETAEIYLNSWCAADTRWLHRFLEADQPEPVYELTPESEAALAFADRMIQQDLGFVGTESRLKLVIDTLADLTVMASSDPRQRLEHLRSEQRRLTTEIQRIEADGAVESYGPARIRERFSTAVAMLKQLQGDFRAVEERFRRITREVQQRQHQQPDSRGRILQYALDAEDLIRQDDQGVSFHEFVRFILSPAQQEKLQSVVQQLMHVDELVNQTDGMDRIQQMIPSLLAEAEKVMRTSQRLSATLRRLLDTRSHLERQKVATILGDIRSLAVALSDDPPQNVGIDIDTNPEIACPIAKQFWVEPAEFEHVDLTEHAIDDQRRIEAFASLAQMQRIDWRSLRSRVADAVARYDTPTLSRILDDHPPESGIVEVLGYLQIAYDDGHYISIEAEERIVIPATSPEQKSIAVTVPLVRFMVT